MRNSDFTRIGNFALGARVGSKALFSSAPPELPSKNALILTCVLIVFRQNWGRDGGPRFVSTSPIGRDSVAGRRVESHC